LSFVQWVSEAEAEMEALPEWFERWEQSLSRFRGDSELSLLNERAGSSRVVSRLLFENIKIALEAAHLSQGLVDPTMLEALELAGYDRPFESMNGSGVRQVPPDTPLAAGMWRLIELEPVRQAVRVPEGIRLDLGGTAKAWAAEEALRRLRRLGPALVDAGGDIAVAGPTSSGPWWIGIADPLGTGVDRIASVLVETGFIATSGRDHRRWQAGDVWFHHILDPRTGLPADTDALSVTTISRSSVISELAAKSALILGMDEGLRWMEAQPRVEALLVGENGEVRSSTGMREFLVTEAMAGE
jgi:thiamine biosynthesis lipoprotein